MWGFLRRLKFWSRSTKPEGMPSQSRPATAPESPNAVTVAKSAPPSYRLGPIDKNINLGCTDADIDEVTCSIYSKALGDITRVDFDDIHAVLNNGLKNPDKFTQKRLNLKSGYLTVRDLQNALRDIDFYKGGEIDGICGYRTQSAIRLFQEYVRSQEGYRGLLPDGLFGPKTNAHLQRWLSSGQRANWHPQPGLYDEWLNFLKAVHEHRHENAFRDQVVIDGFLNVKSDNIDTKSLNEWIIAGGDNIHLISVRRKEFISPLRFDDIFILLIKGMVFMFQGSTEPGAAAEGYTRPYLLIGQHSYHFGWHRRRYLALRPYSYETSSGGVVVVREGVNKILEDSDYNSPEPNSTINIHWAGRGAEASVSNWSEGCQVITGTYYIDPKDELQDCSGFVALNNTQIVKDRKKTRGAYNVIQDIITVLSSNMSPMVTYTLLSEDDFNLAPRLKGLLESARIRVLTAINEKS